MNDTEKNDTISSYPSFSDREVGCNQIDMMDTYRSIVKENIAYEVLVHDGMWSTQELEEIVELIVEVMMLPDEMPVRIGGSEKMAAVIKSRFMKLTMMHITYVLNAANPVTSGPFKVKQLDVGQQLIVEPNEYYYGEQSEFSQITFLTIDEETALSYAQSGMLDVVKINPEYALEEITDMHLETCNF